MHTELHFNISQSDMLKSARNIHETPNPCLSLLIQQQKKNKNKIFFNCI